MAFLGEITGPAAYPTSKRVTEGAPDRKPLDALGAPLGGHLRTRAPPDATSWWPPPRRPAPAPGRAGRRSGRALRARCSRGPPPGGPARPRIGPSRQAPCSAARRSGTYVRAAPRHRAPIGTPRAEARIARFSRNTNRATRSRRSGSGRAPGAEVRRSGGTRRRCRVANGHRQAQVGQRRWCLRCARIESLVPAPAHCVPGRPRWAVRFPYRKLKGGTPELMPLKRSPFAVTSSDGVQADSRVTCPTALNALIT